MSKVSLVKINETFMKVVADTSIRYELKEFLTFDVPGARWSPKYKAGVWDGTISLLVLPQCNVYIGLLDKIIDFCESSGYELDIDPAIIETEDVTPKEIYDFVQSLNVSAYGVEIDAHDYQLLAIYRAIKYRRLTLLSPTSSGKSFIIYCYIRWVLDHGGNVLLLVPTINLYNQMLGDFDDYSSANGFDVSAVVNKTLTISTWQSVYKECSDYFNGYSAIVVDECHLAQATSIRGIMEKATAVKFRFGLTGTLSDTKTHEWVITGLFGKILRTTTTRELIDRGIIADIKIKCIVLNYKDKTERVVLKNAEYKNKLAYIAKHEKRSKFIANYALNSSTCKAGNVLILVQFVENHGQPLYDMISAMAGNRKVFFIHGDVDGDVREEIRNILETETDAILVASYGTFSAGVSIRNIHTIIAASPTKSVIRVLQSIGRGLRKADGKDFFTWIDLVDDFDNGKDSKKNHMYNHFIRRLEIYTDEKFKYEITEVGI